MPYNKHNTLLTIVGLNTYIDGHSDTGCTTGGPSCLSCPFEVCIYDFKGNPSEFMRIHRQKKVLEAWRAGEPMESLMARYGISRHTFERYRNDSF